MSTGKALRMKRVLPEGKGALFVALDHGATSPQFLEGLTDMPGMTRQVIAGEGNIILTHRGSIRRIADSFQPDTSFGMMLTGSAARHPQGPIVTPVAQVEEALRLGADIVGVYVSLQGEYDVEMIQFLSEVGEACDRLGMPFLAEAEWPDAYQSRDSAGDLGWDYLLYNSRLCAEMGADMVKTNWSGSTETFAKIVEATAVPVVLAGGPVISDAEFLQRMEDAVLGAGAVGCSVGRNIFEHDRPEAMTRAIAQIVHHKKTAAEAMKELGC